MNVASLYAKMTSPYVSAYATSKYGVLGFSEVLRQELKSDRGIHVCTVLPGSIDTPIFRHAANYTGRNIRPVPPVASPGRVARAIVRCAQHPRREVNVGQLHHMASWGHALAPRTYSELAPKAMRLVAIGKDRRRTTTATSSHRSDLRRSPARLTFRCRRSLVPGTSAGDDRPSSAAVIAKAILGQSAAKRDEVGREV